MRNIRKIFSLIMVFVILSGIFIPELVSFVKLRAAEDVRGNTNSNLSNYGLVCEYGGYVYISNPGDSGKLYKVMPDGSKYMRICEDEVQYINIVSGVIYYSNLSDGGAIYSINTDGTNRKKLISENSAYINVVNNTVYYVSISDNWKLRKCSLDGTGAGYLGNQVRGYSLNISNGYAFYININDSLIYRMKISDGTYEAVIAVKASQIVVYDNYVFYINASTSQVYRVDAQGKSTQRIYTYTDYKCSHLAVFNDIIYFSIQEKGGIIGSLEIGDFYSDTDISSVYASCLNAVTNYIYFCNIYENNNNYIYYGNMHRISYDGNTVHNVDDFLDGSYVRSLMDGLPGLDSGQTVDKGNIAEIRSLYDSLSIGAKNHVTSASYNKFVEWEDKLGLDGPTGMVSSVYQFDRTKKYITGISEKTNVSDVKSKITGNGGLGTIKIYNSSDTEVTAGYVGTGFKIRLIYDNKTVEEMTVIIYGDVTGDGSISTAQDIVRVQRHVLQISLLTGPYLESADVTKDGKVTTAQDILRIQKHVLKILVLT